MVARGCCTAATGSARCVVVQSAADNSTVRKWTVSGCHALWHKREQATPPPKSSRTVKRSTTKSCFFGGGRRKTCQSCSRGSNYHTRGSRGAGLWPLSGTLMVIAKWAMFCKMRNCRWGKNTRQESAVATSRPAAGNAFLRWCYIKNQRGQDSGFGRWNSRVLGGNFSPKIIPIARGVIAINF